MTDGFYYWTYRSHPHSEEEFLYDGVLPYVPSSHVAHRMSKDIIESLGDEHAEVEYDLGVHMIVPINEIVKNMAGVENVEEVDQSNIDNSKLKSKARSEITEEDVLSVGERQERMDRHQMGEDVDGIFTLDRDS